MIFQCHLLAPIRQQIQKWPQRLQPRRRREGNRIRRYHQKPRSGNLRPRRKNIIHPTIQPPAGHIHIHRLLVAQLNPLPAQLGILRMILNFIKSHHGFRTSLNHRRRSKQKHHQDLKIGIAKSHVGGG